MHLRHFLVLCSVSTILHAAGSQLHKKHNLYLAPATAMQSANTTGSVEAIQAAINAAPGGTVVLPPGNYSLGSTSLHMKTGVGLQCADPVHTLLFYEGTSAAVIFDSVISSSLSNCQIRMDGATSAQAIRFSNETADTMWNSVNNVVVVNSSSREPIPGQIGLQMVPTAKHAMYWNMVQGFHVVNMDTGIQLTDGPGFSDTGANDNTFIGITLHHCKTGMEIANRATENRVFGLSGSASGLTDENTLLVVGDASGAPANYNMIYGLVSDQGAGGRAWIVNKGVSNTLISGTEQSGRPSIDLGTNSIIERLGAGTSFLKLPQLTGASYPKHLRANVRCFTPARSGGTCTSPLLAWSTPFADAKYTASCTLIATAGQPRIFGLQQIPKGINVTIVTDRAVASTGTVSCIAIHD